METNFEAKGLRVNMRKIKSKVSRVDFQTLKDIRKYPSSVCRKGVGSTPSTVLDACIGFTRNVVALLAG